MRRTWLISMVVLAGCPLPEDTFEVRGGASPGAEVRLLRNRLASKTRCDSLEPLQTTTADADGGFAFTVVRQEITGGESERRFFSVDFGESPNRTRRFWFPDADLDLGPWAEPSRGDELEVELDGAIAWRGLSIALPAGAFDRRHRRRAIGHSLEWKQVPIDSLGRFDVVPVESRIEFNWTNWPGAASSPPSHGVECPFIDVKPCPITDGRFLPFTLPPDSRTLVFNFVREQAVRGILFHGLVLERPAVKVRFDFNFFVDYEQWNAAPSSRVEPAFFDREAEHCIEPGAFLITTANGTRAVIFRVGFEDEAGNLIPVLSLQEMTVR